MFSRLAGIITVSLLSVLGVLGAQQQLQQVTSFGTNPTNTRMYVYRPAGLVAKPPLIVAIHACHGSAQDYFTGTQYANLADQYKSFMVIYPNAPDMIDGCWDVHTTATLTHNGGGDSIGIVSMVKYAISTYGVDSSRVFMTGTSSGAMMTNVLAGAYPDIFKAGSAFAGVPYGCFAGADAWNTDCANGVTTKTAQQWGDLARSGYPGYTGPRPKLQIWQGTADTTLNYHNFGEGIKQWTNVFGYSQTPVTTQQNFALTGWTRTVYGPNFEAVSAQGVPHNIPAQEAKVLDWFGITGQATASPTPTPTPTPTTTPTTSTTVPPASQQTHWGQCGGQGWTGPTVCQATYTCTYSNDWFSQCL